MNILYLTLFCSLMLAIGFICFFGHQHGGKRARKGLEQQSLLPFTSRETTVSAHSQTTHQKSRQEDSSSGRQPGEN